MTKKKNENERDEQDEHNEDHRYEQDKKLEAEFFHGLPEPADEIHKELREQDRIRERQQIEAQQPRQEQAGTPPPAGAFPFTASINEPQATSLPVPEGTEIPKPSISSLNPTDTTIGDNDFTLYVTGENFFRDSVINFAGQDEPTTLNEDGTLSTGVNMSVWHGPDTVPVIVKNGPEVSEPKDFEFKDVPASRSKKGRTSHGDGGDHGRLWRHAGDGCDGDIPDQGHAGDGGNRDRNGQVWACRDQGRQRHSRDLHCGEHHRRQSKMSVELEEYEPNRFRVKRTRQNFARSEHPVPYVISDIMPPTEQVDGRFYTSKSAFRAVGRANGLTEVGTEKLTHNVKRASSTTAQKEARRQTLRKAMEQVRSG